MVVIDVMSEDEQKVVCQSGDGIVAGWVKEDDTI